MSISTFPAFTAPSPKTGKPDELINFAQAMLAGLKAHGSELPNAVWTDDLDTYVQRFTAASTLVNAAEDAYAAAKAALDASSNTLRSKRSERDDARESIYDVMRKILANVTVDPAKLPQVAQIIGWTGGQYAFNVPNAAKNIMVTSLDNSRKLINWDKPDQGVGIDEPSMYYVVVQNMIIGATTKTELVIDFDQVDISSGPHPLVIRAENGAGYTESDVSIISI